MDISSQLEKINAYSRKTLCAEDVFIFDVILCDNEIDRDLERFSHNALITLSSLFIGKTGISDHNPSAQNQLARIFDTQLVSDPSKITSWGQPYEYLKACVYMVRTASNSDIIANIEGGINKEVSISCSVSSKSCSICGADKNKSSCSHMCGKKYSGKLCHTVLDDVSDAYEWSFVAVPAQINAGVTKHFSESAFHSAPTLISSDLLQKANDSIKHDIIRLAFISGGEPCAASAASAVSFMDTEALISFKETLSKNPSVSSQLFKPQNSDSLDSFRISQE